MRLSRVVARAVGIRRIQVETPNGADPQLPAGTRVVVVGGGVAGVSAAVILAERGARVQLLEANKLLGGRLGSVRHELPDGTPQWVDHGFHAFFRQYYNWRAILRRIDPDGSLLQKVRGYPVISTQWPSEDFSRLPPGPPLNLLALLMRSPSVRLRDVTRMDRRMATAMLAFDPDITYREFDGVTAAKYLHALGLPDRAMAMLFEVFAHSFFNRPDEYSAAELLANFHFYFLGNPEGLGFDAPLTDYQTGIWAPLQTYLEKHGVEVVTDERAVRINPLGDGWRVTGASGTSYPSQYLVLALDPSGLRDLVAGSAQLIERAPRLARQVATFASGAPYAVARYWFDGPVDQRRPAFCGVSRASLLDSVSLYHRLDPDAARWARDTGGSVIELHAYACPDEVSAAQAAEAMRGELAALWPETARLGHVDLRARVEANAPAFAPGSHADRPTVRTDADGVFLAGDGIRLDVPGALMERAATSGITAANEILSRHSVQTEAVWSVPGRGLLAKARST